MLLHLAKSMTRQWTGRRVYILQAALDCDAHERRLILAHGLDQKRVYTEPIAFDLFARAEAAYERAQKLSPWKATAVPALYWQTGKMLALALRSRIAFHVTVGDLLAGALLRSPDLRAISDAEAALNEAFIALNARLEQARRFETADEDLLVPGDTDPRAHPGTWPNHWRR